MSGITIEKIKSAVADRLGISESGVEITVKQSHGREVISILVTDVMALSQDDPKTVVEDAIRGLNGN